jgi:hypothetical protein
LFEVTSISHKPAYPVMLNALTRISEGAIDVGVGLRDPTQLSLASIARCHSKQPIYEEIRAIRSSAPVAFRLLTVSQARGRRGRIP